MSLRLKSGNSHRYQSALLALLVALSWLPNHAWAEQEPELDYSTCVENWAAVGYKAKNPELLRLADQDASGKLFERVHQAFKEEVKASGKDSTSLPAKNFDRRTQPALVKALIDPQEAAVAQIMAIRQAKHHIVVGTYILGKDAYAYAFLKELKDALARGVSVDILVDSSGSAGLVRHNLKALIDAPKDKMVDDFGRPTTRDAEIRVRLFNPPTKLGSLVPDYLWHFTGIFDSERFRTLFRLLTHRMHSKLLGVDLDYPEGVAFIGGRNKDGLYYGYEKIGPKTYNDAEIMIRNNPDFITPEKKNLSSTVAREFRALWNHELNRDITGMFFGDLNPFQARQIRKMDKASDEMWKAEGDYSQIMKKLEDQKFFDTGFDTADSLFLSEARANVNRKDVWDHVVNSTGVEKDLTSIAKELRHQFKHTDSEIQIVTPYPNMSDEEITGLIQWMLEDDSRKFTLVTNSLYSGDNIITQHVVDNILIPKLKAKAAEAAAKAGKDPKQFVDRFKIYALGRLDGKEFGGTKYYGKLHAKFANYLNKVISKSKTVVGSYNGDHMSEFNNAEVAMALKNAPITTQAYQNYVQTLISMSYEWGSPEWQQVRNHPKLKTKRIIESVIKKIEPAIDPME